MLAPQMTLSASFLLALNNSINC